MLVGLYIVSYPTSIVNMSMNGYRCYRVGRTARGRVGTSLAGFDVLRSESCYVRYVAAMLLKIFKCIPRNHNMYVFIVVCMY